jgi:hypothetical protein
MVPDGNRYSAQHKYKVTASGEINNRVSAIPFKNALEMELMFATSQL